ncbi:carbohydrate-binding module family 50 protein [Parathielavia appendiculata]|uniref:Carbohydrate-binding module family 50 protein n=1 Tax=Parathielavia appendiculata TaxID=2587402 RepID=A0AAN6U3H8_9PEZI|nr:carbohydrate-binding module family 50 protein [Parathielavia appendiculata]
MKSLHRNGVLRLAVVLLPLAPSLVSTQDESDCQPYRWDFGGLKMREDPADPLPTQGTPIPVALGEVNCRYWTTTPAEVNYYTCSQMAQRYSISNDVLFNLNPGLARDCSNVQPKTDYCVRGCKSFLHQETRLRGWS